METIKISTGVNYPIVIERLFTKLIFDFYVRLGYI